MGQEDVLVEVIINGKDMLQFYSTKENYNTLYEDRDALVDTVKTAFKEGILYSADISNVEDIHSVQFLSEVTDVTVDADAVETAAPEGQQYETYEIIETPMEQLASTAIPEELIIDVGLSSDERLNLCPHCDYRTFNVGHFKIHMRQHTGESPFECDLCDYRSKQKSNLKRHMRQHLLGKDHFECKLCNFTCTQEKVYKRHMILHSRTRPLRPCPFCDYFSTSLAHLTVHIRQHTGETPYHCGLCSYKTVQKSNLTRHLKKHRRGRTSKADKLRCCAHCSYRTPNSAHLLAHIRAAHTGETPYACNLCSYKSSQRSNLKRHLRKHSGERPNKCHLCSYSTAYPYVLKKHIENHPDLTEKSKMFCDACDFFTYSGIDMKRHTRMHSGKPLHFCPICGYISLNTDHLRIHMRKHSLERPYKCKFCNYSSAQKSNLTRHYIYKHAGPRNDGKENYQDNTTGDDAEVKDEDYDEEGAYIQMEVGDGVHITEDEKPEDDENQSVEVVMNEEDVITTPHEQQYEVIEDYDGDGREFDHLSDSGSPKVKNISFLNRNQREKLNEFKRLLQEGSKLREKETNRRRCGQIVNMKSKDVDIVSENIEPYTEEDADTSHENQNSHSSGSHIVRASEVNINQLVTDDSSILIVHEGGEEMEGFEVYNYEVETLDEEGGGTTEMRVMIACELCGFETSTLAELKEHIRTHTGETHQPTITPSYFTCDKCSFRSFKKDDVGRHKALFHGATPPERQMFVCGKCSFRSSKKAEFLNHIEQHKMETETFKCKICELKVSSAEELKSHSRNHIGEEPFECFHCAYLTARKCYLRKHIRRRHNNGVGDKGSQYECYTCGYQTSERSDFHSHIGQHKSEASRTFRCHLDHCRFLTLDLQVYKRHLLLHSGGSGSRRGSDNLDPAELLETSWDEASAGVKRAPLKEYGNLPESDRAKLLKPVSSSSVPSKRLLKEDEPGSPIRKKRKALRSLSLGESMIDFRFKRKFNFNPKNLVNSPKKFESGIKVEFTGEVFKGHGSLRKFTAFGECLQKSDTDYVAIMSHPENESQLRGVYNKLKEILSGMKKTESGDGTSKQFTIYFKEMEEPEGKPDDSLSDVDIDISSDEDMDKGSLKDILSDLDLDDLSDIDLSEVSKPKIPPSPKAKTNGFTKTVPEVIIDLEGGEKLKYIQEKIKQRNEKRKELRRLKAMNFTMDKNLNGTRT